MRRTFVAMTTSVAMTMLAAPVPAAADGGSRARLDRGCWSRGIEPASDDGAARYRRLDTLPPAAEMLPVLRMENGCPRPVVVRYGIGGNPAAPAGR